MLDGHIPPQLPFSLRGSSPHVTHSSSGHTHLPSKRHLDRFSRFVWVPNALLCIMRCQWRSNPQNCLFPLGFLHPARGGPSHGHRQHAQEIWSRSRLWFRRYPSEHIHTHLDTHTQTCSSKYFATLPRATSKKQPSAVLINAICIHQSNKLRSAFYCTNLWWFLPHWQRIVQHSIWNSFKIILSHFVTPCIYCWLQ